MFSECRQRRNGSSVSLGCESDKRRRHPSSSHRKYYTLKLPPALPACGPWPESVITFARSIQERPGYPNHKSVEFSTGENILSRRNFSVDEKNSILLGSSFLINSEIAPQVPQGKGFKKSPVAATSQSPGSNLIPPLMPMTLREVPMLSKGKSFPPPSKGITPAGHTLFKVRLPME
jgi:hypothetical protein